MLEPSIFSERQMFHDAPDAQVCCWERSTVEFIDGEVAGLRKDGSAFLIQPLRETDSLIRWLEVAVELRRHA